MFQIKGYQNCVFENMIIVEHDSFYATYISLKFFGLKPIIVITD